tara:strand:- start:227 stop:850 length:624 start_codon:yes stop_codon:yes gene_type:complete
MSTIKTTNITHGSNSGTANMVLASDGKVTVAEKKLYCPGTIIQVKQTYLSTHESVSVGNNNAVVDYTTDNKLVVAITPTAASSKILVTGHVNLGLSSQNLVYLCLKRSIDGGTASNIGASSDAGNRISAIAASRNNYTNDTTCISVNYLDSPNTTDEVKYFYGLAHSASSSKTVYINTGHDQSGSSNNTAGGYGRTGSTITVMEVAG